MTVQPYTPADVKMIAEILREAGMVSAFFDDSSGSWEVEQKTWQYEGAAVGMLDALASAGRLLPEDTRTVEQFAARVKLDGEPVEAIPAPTTREQAEARVKAHDRERAANPGWRGTAELVHRHQHTTPWEPVPDQRHDHDVLLEAFGNARIQFWVCPVDGHSDRKDPGGRPVLTVDWRGDIAYCTADGCGRNSARDGSDDE